MMLTMNLVFLLLHPNKSYPHSLIHSQLALKSLQREEHLLNKENINFITIKSFKMYLQKELIIPKLGPSLIKIFIRYFETHSI